MARSTQVIYDEMVAFKGQQNELSGLTSDSKVSVWGLILWVVAYGIHVFEVLFDTYRKEVDKFSSKAVYAHEAWWVEKMIEFQYGDDVLLIDDGGRKLVEYAVEDESKRIISRVAVETLPSGGVLFKLAKGETGSLQKLTTEELNAVASYIDKIAPAGTAVRLLSKNADIVRYTIDLYYDPILTKDVVKQEVEAAINSYHENLGFNGGIDLRLLEDEIQKVEGVVSFVTTNAQGKPEGGSFENFNRVYRTLAGYVAVDPNATLNDTINYIPNTQAI